MKTSAIALALLCCSIISCRKEETSLKPLTPTVANLSGTYRVSKVMAQQNNNPPSNITDSYFSDMCERDNDYCLKSNGVFDVIDAGIKCNPTSEKTGGTWLLLNPSTLEINGEQAIIQQWNGKNLDVAIEYGGGVRLLMYYLKK